MYSGTGDAVHMIVSTQITAPVRKVNTRKALIFPEGPKRATVKEPMLSKHRELCKP
jgi:hypothetical protein